ncbi:MAG: hypothetical protein COA50_12780 [Flavobacteriaceae bacterium]|nr:MAG: hypothetical protein COA50_12780 [Flavobacteriaceae bacterium]
MERKHIYSQTSNVFKFNAFNRSFLKVFLLLIACIGLSFSVKAQDAQITITNPSGVNVCDVAETVRIDILNLNTSTLANNTITIALPTGITYEPSSLNDLSSYNVEEQNITNLSSIVLSADNLPGNETISFSIGVTADMDAITFQNNGNVFRNDVTLNFSGGSVNALSNGYNLYYPVLSTLSINPSSKTINSGDSYTRQITIVNAGNGRTSSFLLTDTHASGIELTGVDIGTLNAAKDTISISGSDFSGIGNNDNFFDTNESIVITETITASGCQTATITSTITNIWECGAGAIQGSNSYAHASVSLKTPNIAVATTEELSSCFGDSDASLQTITLTNNGQGKAVGLELDIFKSRGSGYQQDIFSRIDETNITYEIIGGASGTLTPTTTYATDNDGDYSCLGTNPIGRVILDLPDLEVGQQIKVSFITYQCNINVCNGDYVKGWKYELDYADVCAVNTYNKTGKGQDPNDTYMSIFPESPTDINDEETKEFIFTVSSHKNDLPVGDGAKYKVVFDLPTGIAYSNLEFYNNTLWTAESIDYNTSTNMVTAFYELPLPSGFNITKAAFNLDVTGDCDMAGTVAGSLPITMNISYIPDTNCNYEIPFICDETVSVDLHCPSGEVCEGMSFDTFTFERTSFGDPDNNQDGLPDTSGSLDFDRVKTNRVMVGDTIRGTFFGLVNTSQANADWSYGYASQNIEKGTYLNAITASVTIYDASAEVYINCSNVPIVTSVNGLNKTFTYNISPNGLAASCASFTNFKFEEGDSVWVYTDYEVTTNIGGNIEQLKSSNEFYVSNVADPGAGDKYQCGQYNDNYTLIGYFFKNASKNNFTVTSCSKTVSQNFYLSIGDCCSNYNGGNLFPSEYRNWAQIKSATVQIPANYDVSNIVMKIRRTKKTNSSSTETVTNIFPSSVVGQLLTFDLEQYYKTNGGTVNLSDDGFKGTLYMDLSPNCDVPINTYQDLTWKFNFTKGDYLGGGETGLLEASNPDKIRFNPPALVLSSDNPIVDGLTKTVTWDLKVNTSSSSIDTDNAWVHFKNPSEDITILYVIDDVAQDTIAVNGDIYRLGTINGGTAKNLSVVATYGACVPDYITAYSGYECTDYPDTFDDFNCSFTTYGLFVEPKPAQMQVTLAGGNVGDECSNIVEIEIDVSSVKFASVDSIAVMISGIGNSMTFETGSGQLQYPLSNSYQAIGDPTLDNGNYVYELVDLNTTIAADGLPGVLELTQNHFKLKFNMVMDASFKPGDYVAVSVSGQAICGEAIPTINLAFDPSIGFRMASSSGLTEDATDSWSSSWGDYNNDGYDDLFVTTYDPQQPNLLYKNNGDKTFTKITTGEIVTDLAGSVAATWGDYDNDGYLDLFVANNFGSNNFLYHNNGNATFTKITSGAIVEEGTYCHSAAWADYDNDGYLDLFVAEYFPTKTNHLFHNNGNGTFTSVQGSPVVTDAGHSIGASWGDYDNDGLVDLFVPNTNNEVNWLYKNIGNGQFKKVNENVLSTPSNSVGSSWGDYNNDGNMDLFITNTGNSENYLYKNNGDGTFVAITTGAVVTDKGHSHGSTWIDIDNDGDLDLYVTNDQDQDNFLYRNQGDGSFSRIENDLTKLGGNSFGTSIADYDNDGDYDIFVPNHSDTNNFFFENTKGQCSSYICLNLIGSKSNYSALGAKIKVKATIYGETVWQTHEISGQSGGGAGSQNSHKVIFGLGDATIVDELIIQWPSGFKKTYTNVATTVSNCTVYVEDDGAYVSGKAYVDDNSNCSFDEGETLIKNVAITISPDGKKTYTNSDGEYSFYMNTGSYTIAAETPNYYTQLCPTNNGSHTVEVSEIGTTHPNNNFGFVPDGNKPDLSVCLSTTALRLNFTNEYTIIYENVGNNVANNNVITVTLDEGIEFVSSTVPWDTKVGRTAYWNIASIQPQESVNFDVTVEVTTEATWGEYVTNTASISSESTDVNTTNDSCEDVGLIVGAIDPNDKIVYKNNNSGSELTYKIRFQNVGNYEAESVVIYDELSSNLDIRTIRNVLTSHDGIFTIIDGTTLKWEFPDINLPDSEHNEPESHGYVQFTIDAVDNLPLETVIKNTADIVFDYYQTTVTNTTTVVVNNQETENILFAYPVPVINTLILQYKSDLQEDLSISFFNLAGQLTHSESKTAFVGWNKYECALHNLQAGVYYMVVHSSAGIKSQKTILKH